MVNGGRDPRAWDVLKAVDCAVEEKWADAVRHYKDATASGTAKSTSTIEEKAAPSAPMESDADGS